MAVREARCFRAHITFKLPDLFLISFTKPNTWEEEGFVFCFVYMCMREHSKSGATEKQEQVHSWGSCMYSIASVASRGVDARAGHVRTFFPCHCLLAVKGTHLLCDPHPQRPLTEALYGL